MFSRFSESLYLKVFVNIVVGHTKITVYIEMVSKKGVLNSFEEIFETETFDSNIYEFITLHTKESPYFYISILDYSTAQGAIPTCSKQDMQQFYDLSESEYKCYGDKWVYYTAKNDIYAIEHAYEKVGLDFIFSPFSVLTNFFKDKIDTHLAMFILVEENALSLSVFENSELLFAEHLGMNRDLENDDILIDDHDIEEIDIDEEDESINLDDIDAIDDIDELDDFGDIADLDSIEDINEFDETKDIEEELAETEEESEFPHIDSEGFNEDYQRFSLIQSSVNRFYKNYKFNSKFVEIVYIADSIGVSSDLKRYLEEEMFLNVYIRHIDLAAEVCEIAKMELS